MSLPPILLYPGGRRLRPDFVPNIRGEDIGRPLRQAAEAAGIPPALALACIMAESELDPRAERWGRFSDEAKEALASGEHARLRQIIDAAWPDISFGYGQRIVKFHYVGDRSKTLENVLAVRQHVFDNPVEDLQQMASFLAPRLAQARQGDLAPCGGDELLGALAAYNCGHYPAPHEAYWQERKSTVDRYREKLGLARAMLGG